MNGLSLLVLPSSRKRTRSELAAASFMYSTILSHRASLLSAPTVQVIGDLIRQTPGTISLGQGVVHYGPPQAAIEAVRGALEQPATHEYQDGSGLPELVDRLAAKLRAENAIEVGRGTSVMVT